MTNEFKLHFTLVQLKQLHNFSVQCAFSKKKKGMGLNINLMCLRSPAKICFEFDDKIKKLKSLNFKTSELAYENYFSSCLKVHINVPFYISLC